MPPESFNAAVKRVLRFRNKLLLFLTRPNNFSFKPGQFVTFTITDDTLGEITRAYSIASLPIEEALLFYISLKKGGMMSTFLQKLSQDDTLLIRGPFGVSTPEKIGKELKAVVFIAAGTGIAPIRPVAWWYTQKADVKVYVLHQARFCDELVFKDDFLQWGTEYRGFLSREDVNTPIVSSGYLWQYLENLLTELGKEDYRVVAFGPKSFVEELSTRVKQEHLILEGW